MGITSNLLQAIEDLGVAQGEIDNVMEAALRDLGDNIINGDQGRGGIRDEWPIFGGPIPSESKRSLSTRVPATRKGPHSKGLWHLDQRAKLSFFVVNPADYAEFVHTNLKDHPAVPEGLATRLFSDVIDQVEGAELDFISESVAALIDEAGR